MSDRIAIEQNTILKMIMIFCKRYHNSNNELCRDCRNLVEYVENSLFHCHYGASKPVCGRCPDNCFSSVMQARMANVMRYAGPQMLYKHPVLSIKHILHTLKLHIETAKIGS